MKAYKWGNFSGQYTHEIGWKGVPLTVECDVDDGDVLPIRVLCNGVDVTKLVDTDDGELHDLVKQAHDEYCRGGE